MTKKQFVIFYSWQADLPNATNRGLFESELELAGKTLTGDTTKRVC